MHFPQMIRCAACSMELSAHTMQGDLPPSSSVTGVRWTAAAFITERPTLELPVKKMESDFCYSKASASSRPPSTRAMYSGAQVALMSLASAAEVWGASSEAFKQTQLPAAIAPTNGVISSWKG